MSNKRASYEIAEFKADGREDHKGEFDAVVSVFGNVDKIGDRVMPGAFKRSLADYGKSGDPIPVIWSHDWADPFAHIGKASAVETDRGLQVSAKLDIDDNPIAAQVFRLLSERRVKEFSFGYEIRKERTADDGANELVDLGILEVGPTLKGMNPATELLATKAEEEAVAETKAGRRLSRASETELAGIREDASRLIGRIDGLLGTAEDADDEPKSHTTTEEPPATAVSETEETKSSELEPSATSDDDLLAFTLRIEQLRAS